MKHLKKLIVAACLFTFISATGQQKKEKTAKRLTPVSAAKPAKGQDGYDDFRRRNPDIAKVNWRKGNILRIEKTDGTIETYDLDVAAQKNKAEDLYGILPPAPPPPPKVAHIPPPPPPPVPGKSSIKSKLK